MTIAHYLTFIRIFISPIFLLVYIEHQFFGISATALPFVLLTLWGISELSDAFDGYLARKYNQVTELGKILDPMADSIYRISVLLTFTQPPVNLHLLLIFVFIYRDSVIGTLRTICGLRGIALGARKSGKIKAVLQATAVCAIILLMIPQAFGYLSLNTLHLASTAIVGAAAVYTLYSGMDYIIANRKYILRMLAQPKTKIKEKTA